MEISGVTAAEAVKQAAGKQTLGKEDFMKLLLKQLSYQDPLNPMESGEFTSQLTQFSSLERLGNIDSTLKNVLDFQQSMQNASISNLLGRTINSPGNAVYLKDGGAAVNYELEQNAANVEIKIYDETGKEVFAKDLDARLQGNNLFVWDGKDVLGNQMPDGLYEVDIKASNVTGDPLTVKTITAGVVTGISFTDGMASLVLDGSRSINLNEIETIQ